MLQLDERLDANSPDSIIHIRARWLRWKPRTCHCHSDTDTDSDSDAVSISDTDRCSDSDSDGICLGECFADGEGSGGLRAAVGRGEGKCSDSGG